MKARFNDLEYPPLIVANREFSNFEEVISWAKEQGFAFEFLDDWLYTENDQVQACAELDALVRQRFWKKLDEK